MRFWPRRPKPGNPPKSAQPTGPEAGASDYSEGRPLGDPLRTIRRWLGRLMVVGIASTLFQIALVYIGTVWADDQAEATPKPESSASSATAEEVGDADTQQAATNAQIENLYKVFGLIMLYGVLTFPLMFLSYTWPIIWFVWRILPSQTTNALWLRSFRFDNQSWPMRKAANLALGRSFRLSGIRDPRRRRPWLDYVLWHVFILQYSTPKHMNLEAGEDWKARVWRSLADCRCVVIDVVDVTSFLREEIELAYHCVGLDRILFLGGPRLSVDEWRERVAELLPHREDDASRIHVAVWDPATREARNQFTQAVRTFTSALPVGTSGLQPEAFHLTKVDVYDLEPVPMHSFGGCLSTGCAWQVLTLPVGLLVGCIVPGLWELVIISIVGAAFVTYMIDCGSNRERRLMIGSIFAVIGLYTGMYFAVESFTNEGPGQIVQESTDDGSACRANLATIGEAFEKYREAIGSYPPAYLADESGEPLHSWRVLILPYLEEVALYDRYNFDEPWDGPTNKVLLGQMPDVFLCPSQASIAGSTHYLIVHDTVTAYRPASSPATAGDSPQRPTFEVQGRSYICGPTRGAENSTSSDQAIIVEAADGVPWTEPSDLDISGWAGSDEPSLIVSCHDEGAHRLDESGLVTHLPARLTMNEVLICCLKGIENPMASFAHFYNQTAWDLATSPSPEKRDGSKAVKLAERACELSGWDDAKRLDTLAAAYAETGDFSSAVRWQEAAMAAVPRSDPSYFDYGARLTLYRVRSPFRTKPEAATPGRAIGEPEPPP